MFLYTLPRFESIASARRLTGVSYLGGINTSSKLAKNLKVSGHYTYIVYLAPSTKSGFDLCPYSTPECRSGCLAKSGRARMELGKEVRHIERSRLAKAVLLKTNPDFYMRWLVEEISAAKAKASRDGFLFSVRLNGTSDVDYTKLRIDGRNVFEIFPEVTFYDYTKDPNRFSDKPVNYHLTFSYTGYNWADCERLLSAGENVAMVFNLPKGTSFPATYRGHRVTDGDLTDLRVDEARGVIIGLYWKNSSSATVNERIKKSIFVIQSDDLNLI